MENKLAEKIQENSKNYGILKGWKISLISPALQSSFQCFKTMFLTDVYDNIMYLTIQSNAASTVFFNHILTEKKNEK